ncbi:MAG TPA: proton-conducting transporter membrane subunit, partial [Puia sp.]|nr:proton-conducting transporter membrane subunit [Puia sp.]
FLGAGSVIHAMGGEQDMRKMGGLRKWMPATHITFLLGCLAISGIPPFSGFFSKDEILSAAYAKNPIYYVIGVFTALLTAFYMFRLYVMTFRGSFRGTHELEDARGGAGIGGPDEGHARSALHESPAAMTIPLWALAILATVAGFLGIPAVFAPNAHWLGAYLAPVLGENAHGLELEKGTEGMLMVVSVVLAVIGVVGAWARFSKKPELGEPTGFGKFLANKWYVDELYNAVIVKPLDLLAQFLTFFDKNIIDGIVNGVGRLVQYGSRQLRLLQSGLVGGYVLLMVIGILVLFLVELFTKH